MKERLLKLLAALKKYRNILIFIKGSPDPDALASSYALKYICDNLKVDSVIIARQKLSLFQNREFVRLFEIPVKFDRAFDAFHKFDAYAILDHQSASLAETNKKLPCVVHVDHHEVVEEDIPVDFKFINSESGSSSTLMALLLEQMDLENDGDKLMKIASALTFGIKTDTDKYDFAEKMDFHALHYLTKFSNAKLVKKISGIPLSKKLGQLLKKATENELLYKDWLIAHLGFLAEADRDNIAIIADFLLKKEKVNTVIVYAVIKGEAPKSLYIDASFRTSNADLDLNSIIKDITPSGGGRRYKGAFQVNIDYFNYNPNKEELWKLIENTTIEAVKKSRDNLLKTELKGFFKRLRDRFFLFYI